MESPFKFLDSYTREDSEIFFGRDLEVEEVYSKVFQAKTLFLYGESGTGKSSLINCGLANKFKDSDWLPINIRRGSDINESLIQELKRLTLTEVKNLNGSFSKNLFKYTRSLYLDYFKPIYFIFDQFEELYLMGTKGEWKEFVSGIKSLADRDLQVHFIFVIRAEYLHFMTELEEDLPDIFNNKLRIEKITRLKAKDCIEGPAKVYDIQLEDGFSDMLFDQLSPDSNEIELTYLQVFLDRVYKKACESSENGQILFSKDLLDDIGMVNDVLSDFLDEQIDTIDDKESTLLVLKSFVTVEGTKRQASIEDVMNFSKSIGQPLTYEIAESKIRSLLERRILKELPDTDNYELRHDALASKIFEKITLRERELIEVRQFLEYGLAEYQKRGFLLNELDLTYIKPHLEVLDLSDELKEFVRESLKSAGKKQRFRKRVIAIIVIIIALSITSLWGFFYAQRQKAEAVGQKTIAEQNAIAAKRQKEIAEQNEDMALFSKQRAELSAEEAKIQAELANQQQTIANEERLIAQSSQEEAELQRQIALLEKDSAESARFQAVRYLQEANREREKSERLSMQSLARSLGIKAAQLPDLELKSLLALQAYLFNQQYDGYLYQADIYNGLYQAFKQAEGADFNQLKVHTSAITQIHHTGDRIYTTGSDGMLISWSSDLSQRKTLANTGMINNTMAISPDQSKIAIGTATSTIFIYDAANGDLISRYTGHNGEVWEVLFVDDNLLISSGKDKKILQWDVRNGSNQEVKQLTSDAHAIAFSRKGNVLVLGLKTGMIHELSTATMQDREIGGRFGDMVTCLVFNHDNSMLAVGYESGTIQLLNADQFQLLETLPGHTAHVTDIKFSDDDKLLISGSYDRRSLIWNLAKIKEQPISLTDHDSFVWAVGFSPSGKEVISGELNGTMRKYNVEMDRYANQLCDQVSRNMTKKEWQTFVRDDIPYKTTCMK